MLKNIEFKITIKINTIPDDFDNNTQNDNVTINIESSNKDEGIVSSDSIIFYKSNWNSENKDS